MLSWRLGDETGVLQRLANARRRKRRGHGRNDAKDALAHVDSSRLKQYPTGRVAVNALHRSRPCSRHLALEEDRSDAEPRAEHEGGRRAPRASGARADLPSVMP